MDKKKPAVVTERAITPRSYFASTPNIPECNGGHLVFLIWFDFLSLAYTIFGPLGAQVTGHGLLIDL